jgi:hypothetical protein
VRLPFPASGRRWRNEVGSDEGPEAGRHGNLEAGRYVGKKGSACQSALIRPSPTRRPPSPRDPSRLLISNDFIFTPGPKWVTGRAPSRGPNFPGPTFQADPDEGSPRSFRLKERTGLVTSVTLFPSSSATDGSPPFRRAGSPGRRWPLRRGSPRSTTGSLSPKLLPGHGGRFVRTFG